MGYTSLHYCGFRNIKDGELLFQGKENFFIGENGQGKSNILESIYMLCFGSSFRGSQYTEIVKRDSESFALKGIYKHETLSYSEEVRVSFLNGKKNFSIDDKSYTNRKELLTRHPCIIFCHEDMEFALGSPEKRRWFFDQAICMTEPSYIDILCDYKKILRTRNLILKEKNYQLLDVLDLQLASSGHELVSIRDRIVADFNKTFSHVVKTVLGESVGISIKYVPSWPLSYSIEHCVQHLLSKRNIDSLYSTTGSGPHRDRFLFKVDEREFTKTASTGQNRLVALALRISEAIHLEKKTGRLPILLFDDVFLEIDMEKKRRLLTLLPPYEQAFFTFIPGEPYESYLKPESHVYYVVDGHYTD